MSDSSSRSSEIDSEWKRLLLGVLPQLEVHAHEFWGVLRENPEMFEELGRHLVRAACDSVLTEGASK